MRYFFLLILFFVMGCSQWVFGSSWSTPSNLSADGNHASCPKVSMNDVGQVVAIWVRGAETQVAEMTYGGSWSSPTVLRSEIDEIGYAPSVKINAEGLVLAIWGGGFFNEPYSGVFSSTLCFGKNWSVPISAYMGELDQDSQLAFNDSGQATMVLTNEVVPVQVKATKYSWGGYWDCPFILSDQGYAAHAAQVAMCHHGRIGIVWQQSDGYNERIFVQLSSFDGYWPSVWPMYGVRLSVSGQDAETPQITMNDENQTIVVWSRSDGTNKIIQKACIQVGESWSAPADLSLVGQDAEMPRVAMNSTGQFVIVWKRSNGTHTIIQARSGVFGGALGDVVDLSAVGQHATDPEVVINDAGQAIALWKRSNGTNDIIQVATLNMGGGWSAPVDLSATGKDADCGSIAINSKGEAVAVWSRMDTTYTRIQASYLEMAPAAPQNLSGAQMMASSAMRLISYYNQICWEASASTNVVEYRIYRDGVLIETRDASKGLFFENRYQEQGVTHTYEVSAVTSSGAESVKASIDIP